MLVDNKKYRLRSYGENGAGFGIIEALVAVAIISVLTVIAISNFPKVKVQMALSRAAHEFAQDLRLAQEMAISGSPHKSSSGFEQEIDGYGINVDITNFGNKKYLIYADKSPGNEKYDNSDYLVKEIDFSSKEPGVKMQEIKNTTSDNVSLNFKISRIKTTITQLSPGQNKAEFVFSLEDDEVKTKSVLINTSGLIETK